MVDFLKSNPYVTREEYLWEWTIAQIHLASMDFTHTVYLGDKKGPKVVDEKSYEDPKDFMNDLGIPMI